MLAAGCVTGCGAPQLPPRDPGPATAIAKQLLHASANLGGRAAELPEDELLARLDLAGALIDEAEYDRALEHLAILQRARPMWHTYRYQEARALLRGRADVDGAMASVEACLELRPDFADCHLLQGLLYSDAGRPRDAIDSWLRAEDVAPWTRVDRERLARAALQANDLDRARDWAEEAVEETRGSVPALLIRATVSERLGDLDGAHADFAAIAARHVDPVAGDRYLLGFYRRTGDADRADAIQRRIERRLR
jgi:tetratricopeptide (TPR) repeat protein